MDADGREKEPIWPMRGRMTGKGSVGEGWKDTWRTGVVFIMVCMVVKEYTAGNRSEVGRNQSRGGVTLVLVSVDSIVDIFRVLEIMSNHDVAESLGLCQFLKE